MSISVHVLRVTLEAETPLSIGSGSVVERTIKRPKESGEDKKEPPVIADAIIRDPNGLPAIPGTSTQGVLRRLMEDTAGEERAKEIFGYEEAGGKGQAASLTVSWGCVHDSRDVAIAGLQERELESDPVLELLLSGEPIWRDRVALSATHSVEGLKKFAKVGVPAGTRFSIEFIARGGPGKRALLIEVARLFRHRRFRLGSGAGIGWGKCRLVRASYQAGAPGDRGKLREILSQPPSKPLARDIVALEEFSVPEPDVTVATLSLEFNDALHIGCGEFVEEGGSDEGKNLLKVLRETRLDWDSLEMGTTTKPLPLLTGSGLRGALSHRMHYYARKYAKYAGETLNVDEALKCQNEESQKTLLADLAKKLSDLTERRPDTLVDFLGKAKEVNSSGDIGSESHLAVGDASLDGGSPPKEVKVQRIAIDRFTGGTRTGALYKEEWLVGARARVELVIRKPRSPSKQANSVAGWDGIVSTCFLRALKDLCSNRLPVGAMSLGVCHGTVSWSGVGAEEWESAAESVGLSKNAGSES